MGCGGQDESEEAVPSSLLTVSVLIPNGSFCFLLFCFFLTWDPWICLRGSMDTLTLYAKYGFVIIFLKRGSSAFISVKALNGVRTTAE